MKSVFGSVESRKYAILEFLPFLNFGFGEFLYFIRVEIYTKKNLEYHQNVTKIEHAKRLFSAFSIIFSANKKFSN